MEGNENSSFDTPLVERRERERMEGGGNGRFDDIFQLRCLRSVAQILSETMGIGMKKGHSPFLLFGPRFVSAFGSEPRDALTICIARGPLLPRSLFVSQHSFDLLLYGYC